MERERELNDRSGLPRGSNTGEAENDDDEGEGVGEGA
jgi:hypothetical protein